jgi:hypothetical protein
VDVGGVVAMSLTEPNRDGLVCSDCGEQCREEREIKDDAHQVHVVWTVCAYCGQSTLIERAYFKKYRPTQH